MGLKNKLSGVHIQIHSKLRWWIINCPIDIQFCRICVYHCKPMYTCILYTPFSDPLGYRPPPHFHLKWRSLFKIQIDWGMVHTCRNGVLRKELDVGSHCWIPLFINWSLAKHIPYSTGFDFEFGYSRVRPQNCQNQFPLAFHSWHCSHHGPILWAQRGLCDFAAAPHHTSLTTGGTRLLMRERENQQSWVMISIWVRVKI